MSKLEADICVIGAGSAGLSVAAGASQMGARVVLVEKGEMGGDCLNYGCVPSKALLAAGKAAQHAREAGKFGVTLSEPQIDFAEVSTHVRGVIAGIAPHDSQDRFEGLGVTVIREPARFTSPDTLEAGDTGIRAKRFVIATGSQPAMPPIEGLQDVSYLTNETLFGLTVRPEHLIVIGGGPIGCEMAQAHRRLGSRVTLLEAFTLLPKDDPDLVAIVRARLVAEGVDIRESAKVSSVSGRVGAIAVSLGSEEITGSHLLVATGRVPNVAELGLETAGVAFSNKGISVDRRLRTTNQDIYAIGDVTGGYQFTHQASYHAGIVIQNCLFRIPAKTDDSNVPWVTYTEPELAHAGLSAAQLAERHRGGKVLEASFADNDRARTERQTDGAIKVMVDRRGRIKGVSIVGANAGELLQPWLLAMAQGLKIRAMTGFRAPYPTLGEINKAAAGSYFTPKLYSKLTRLIVRALLKLP